MARPIHYDEQFLQDLGERVRWLRRKRPAQQIANLQRALSTFIYRVATFPGAAPEVARRGTTSYRVRLLGEPLPYLVYYFYDKADEGGPVTLLMLLHEDQNRERFDPGQFE